ncbi:MAG: hypothetical protein ACLGQU_01995 [Acidobacteriota bacterium]
MRFLHAIGAALLLQAGLPSLEIAPPARALPQHLRYVRSLSLPAEASGVACAVLDGSVYAHASSPSLDDLRIFRVPGGGQGEGGPQEVPFVVIYSQAQPSSEQTATGRNLRLTQGALEFDLEMPARAYTQVDLHLAARNFIATAEVTGWDSRAESGRTAQHLGEFVLFDLSAEHLARWTSLALQESTFPKLHFRLRLRSLSGGAFPHLSPAIVQSATVPANREAQTLYSVVAGTSALVESGGTTIAVFHVPAHVPIERVQFLLNPKGPTEFLRKVVVTAQAEPSSAEADPPQETVSGRIWRVDRPADLGAPAVRAAKLAFAAVIASNLHAPATIRVAVEDHGEMPLSLQAVQLEMRRRTLCFEASAGAAYTLRYGEAGLGEDEPGDGVGALAGLPADPIVAKLGLEEINQDYIRRPVPGRQEERSPDLRWIALLAAIAVFGTAVSRRATRQGRRR